MARLLNGAVLPLWSEFDVVVFFFFFYLFLSWSTVTDTVLGPLNTQQMLIELTNDRWKSITNEKGLGNKIVKSSHK